MLKKRFKEYFTFTKRERNGIVVLLFILFVLIILRIYQTNLSYGEIVLMNDEFKKEIEEFEKSLITKEKTYRENDKNKEMQAITIEENWTKPMELFNFDPNNIKSDQLEKLGFSQKQINTLTNYRAKGGRFFKKEDLLKIYGLEQKQYEILEPYIVIENEENFVVENQEIIVEEVLVEINSAVKDDLIKLKGIGEAYSKRIIKYRNKLGGYYHKDQLLEVYGLDSIKFVSIKDDVEIDTSFVQKLSLNKADFDQLVKHPYLNKYQTESILKYRELVGEFSKLEEIYLNKLLTKEEYFKLKPYLKLN